MNEKGYTSVVIDGLNVVFPATWDTMNLHQLRFLASLMESRRSAVEVCIMMVMCAMSGRADVCSMDDVQVYRVHVQGLTFVLTAEQMTSLAECFGFLFDDVSAPQPSLSPRLTVNHFPVIDHAGCVLHGPSDGMLDIPFGRYIWLQTYMSGAGKDSHNLNLALASLWRSSDDGDEPSDADACVIGKLPAWQRMVMLWYVSGCLARIHRLFPRVFGGGGSGAVGNVLDQQLRLLDSLAQSDMTKKDQVRRGKLVDALYVIDESLRRMEERERELAKKKK